MRVFVTGASGFVGSAIVEELLNAGHQVLGLARSDESARKIIAAGAAVHQGSIYDLDSLRSGAAAADAVIHTAFNHDFSKYKENCETDRKAIEAMGDAITGTSKPMVITSGTALLSLGRPVTEQDKPLADSTIIPRVASEEAAAAITLKGVNVSVVRLPPSVHGEGDHGFVPMLIDIAREKGVAAYIGEGLNNWAGVHRVDAARLYRLIIEQSTSPATYHCVADEAVPFKEITQIIAKHLNMQAVSITPEQATEHFGWLAHFAGIDSPASSQWTQLKLGWEPQQPGLIADIDSVAYFKTVL
ncbi:SDR family oxidoreductase [Mucilaginibacter koreensis]